MFKTGRDHEERQETRTSTTIVETERSRFAPGALAGDEPLIGHQIDPDAEESMLDDALVAAEEQEAEGGEDEAPALIPATLADQRGVGIVRLVWDADGEVIETMGSWRPLEGSRDALPVVGTEARFTGNVYLGPQRSVPVDTRVVISGGATYTDVHGNDVTLVRFTAPGLVADHRFART